MTTSYEISKRLWLAGMRPDGFYFTGITSMGTVGRNDINSMEGLGNYPTYSLGELVREIEKHTQNWLQIEFDGGDYNFSVIDESAEEPTEDHGFFTIDGTGSTPEDAAGMLLIKLLEGEK